MQITLQMFTCSIRTETNRGDGHETRLPGCFKKFFGDKEKKETMTEPIVSGAGNTPASSNTMKKGTGLTRVLQPAHTIRLRPEQDEPAGSSRASKPFSLSSSGLTDTGRVREHNEDSYAMVSFGNKSLFVVADGMGGHDSGEVASKTAADTVSRVVQEEHRNYDDPLMLVEQAVRQANTEVRRMGAKRRSDMGTTLSVAYVADDTAYIANVGDSRVYWMENGSLSQVTTDHSLVAKLVETGKLSPGAARNHPRANLLYRTIGIDEDVKVDTFRVELKFGGTLLLCTDGLWNELTDEDIHDVCAGTADVKGAAERLVRMASERGGRDNITAVVVRVV